MLKKIKYFWKDPVLSKVISVGMISTLSLIYNFTNSKFKNISFKIEFIKFWTLKIQLWHIAVLLCIIIVIHFLTMNVNRFKYDEETLKLDRDFFVKIRESYLTEEMMLVPKNHGFSSSTFSGESLYRILNIYEESKKSNFEFINPVLEQKMRILILEVGKLHDVTSKYIFGTNNAGALSIPREWAHQSRERFDEARKNIIEQENLLTEKYDDLIKTGRRVLKV